LPQLKYGKKLPEAQNFCLNLTWKNNIKNSTYAEVGDQKLCELNNRNEDLI